MLKSLAIGTIVGFTATAALAQVKPAQAQEFPRLLGVWDSNAQFVGTLIGEGTMALPNGISINADPYGNFFGQDAFYFTSFDCSGPPYLLANELIPNGAVFNGSLFYVAHVAKIELGSWTIPTAPTPNCTKASQLQLAGLATQAPLPKITPPLCVSPTKIRCQ